MRVAVYKSERHDLVNQPLVGVIARLENNFDSISILLRPRSFWLPTLSNRINRRKVFREAARCRHSYWLSRALSDDSLGHSIASKIIRIVGIVCSSSEFFIPCEHYFHPTRFIRNKFYKVIMHQLDLCDNAKII